MRGWTGCVILICFFVRTYGQKLAISGSIFSDSNSVIQFSYIKIVQKSNNRILSFFNTGKSNTFSVDVLIPSADTVIVTASHIGYKTVSLARFAKGGDSFRFDLVMPLNVDSIKDVMIKAPPVWVRGDTTFFNANAFKEGGEKKLKELLLNMPGFEIDDRGNLLYKKKIVEKVMVEGEDIFADKVKLMLNNFPVHVISTIQVLENQNTDPLKKGLVNENKVFLNIGLNKDKLKAAFGDGEVGVGNTGRYLVNPVLFSLYGKLKAGYIGNWNNIGSGLDWREQDELTSNNTLMGENWMMGTNQFQIINEMDSRRYITNGQIDNRLQFDIPLSKSLKSILEFNLIKDHQAQTVYNNSNIYNGQSYIGQADTSYTLNTPLLLTAKYTLNWKESPNRNFAGSIAYYYNGNQSQSNQFYFQQGVSSNLFNNISNHLNSYEISLSSSSRPSESRFESWSGKFAQHYYPQSEMATSSTFPSIFHLPDSSYQLLSHHLLNKSIFGSLNLDLIKKTAHGTWTGGASIDVINSKVINGFDFNSPTKNATEFSPGFLNGSGTYNAIAASGHLVRAFSLWALPVSFTTEDGVAFARILEGDSVKTFATPQFNLSLDSRENLFVNLTQEVKLSVDQKQTPCYKFYGILLPTSVSSFQRYADVSLPVRSFNFNYNLGYSPVPRLSSSLVFGYTRKFTDYTEITGLDQFVQTNVDSLVARGTNTFYVQLGGGMSSAKEKPIIDYQVGYNNTQFLLPFLGQLFSSSLGMYSASLGLNGYLGSRYYVRFSTTYIEMIQRLPSEIQNSIPGRVSYLHSSLTHKYRVSKRISLLAVEDWYNNNLLTNHQNSAILFDATISYTLLKIPLSFSLMGNNISNRRSYGSSDISPLSQRFFSTPLIGREIFFSVRYDL